MIIEILPEYVKPGDTASGYVVTRVTVRSEKFVQINWTSEGVNASFEYLRNETLFVDRYYEGILQDFSELVNEHFQMSQFIQAIGEQAWNEYKKLPAPNQLKAN